MLQRAASNAYSWWWASHIRTKQSKWLEHNLQDMEDRVESMLKVIDQDGDSFAKRAEMYYKKRPELINSVEESYRSYRALAERYDHISRELQSANRTIATVYPEQVQFALDDEDGESFSERSTPSRDPISPNPAVSPQIPKVPKKLYKTPSMFISGKSQPKGNTSTSRTIMTSGLSKSEALEELDRIQKQVLVLQTEKEFVKSSYENGITKYYEIENLITEMQEKACSLQDEFGIGTIIEDSEARSLMATTALKSCRETLVQLREKQERTAEEARMAHERIMEAHDSLETLKDEFLQKHSDVQEPAEEQESASTVVKKEKRDLEALRQKIKERLEKESGTSFLTVTELTENIDGIVDKVVTLETAVHSQDALVKRLKSETDELQTQVRKLEEEKETLMEDSEIMRNRISELEKELQRVKNLNSTVEDKNDDIETHFTEASCDIDHLSDKLQSAKLDDEVEGTGLFPEVKAVSDADPEKEFEAEEKNAMEADVLPNEEPKKQKKDGEQGTDLDMELQDLGTEGDEPNWQQLFLNGLEDRDKFLMEEYVSILRNFKEVKKRLSEVEEKNRESHFEAAMQIRELKNSNTLKDEEIQSLRQKLSLSQPNPDENQKDEGSTIQRSMDSPATNVFKVIHVDEYRGVPSIEEKFRSDIDDLLEENLEFWLRFSSSFHQMQKFQTSIQDLQGELSKLKEMKNHEGELSKLKEMKNHEGCMSLKSDALPIYKHLREIQTELTLWLEHNSVLNDELQNRFSSLCNIQEEISRVSNVSSISIDPELSNYQAAKFQGEVMNMKQENNKVAQELKASLNRVKSLQAEVQRAMSRLDEDFSLSESKKVKFNKKNSSSGPRIPLRTFLFGVKLKKQKQKPSMFSCMSPALQKQYSDLRSGLPPR